ncbi:MAG TPA: aminomethyltransferase family protein [Pyrinomonadaceae bacterium]|jgi:folate-binding protein YgfZ
MTQTVEQAQALPLAELHRQQGATLVERDGRLVPAHYGDAAAEYEAVRGGAGAGLFDLSARGRVEVRGAEAVQFLNGLITNDVKALAPGAWMHAAFPNVQGRLLAAARVLRPTGETVFLFDTEAATRARVRESLARFTLAGDFHVRDLTDETTQFSLQGAGSQTLVARVLGASAARVERMHVAAVEWQGHALTVARMTETGEDGFALIGSTQAGAALWPALVAAGARPAGADALEVLRVEAGVARYGVDATEANVVLEAVAADAVSFTKGCYVGQEIIARIHWRGHVAKRLAGLLLGGETTPDAKITTADGKEIGRVTSAVFSPRLGRAAALGIVKYDYLAPGTEVRVGAEAVPATVAELPLVRGSWYEEGL